MFSKLFRRNKKEALQPVPKAAPASAEVVPLTRMSPVDSDGMATADADDMLRKTVEKKKQRRRAMRAASAAGGTLEERQSPPQHKPLVDVSEAEARLTRQAAVLSAQNAELQARLTELAAEQEAVKAAAERDALERAEAALAGRRRSLEAAQEEVAGERAAVDAEKAAVSSASSALAAKQDSLAAAEAAVAAAQAAVAEEKARLDGEWERFLSQKQTSASRKKQSPQKTRASRGASRSRSKGGRRKKKRSQSKSQPRPTSRAQSPGGGGGRLHQRSGDGGQGAGVWSSVESSLVKREDMDRWLDASSSAHTPDPPLPGQVQTGSPHRYAPTPVAAAEAVDAMPETAGSMARKKKRRAGTARRRRTAGEQLARLQALDRDYHGGRPRSAASPPVSGQLSREAAAAAAAVELPPGTLGQLMGRRLRSAGGALPRWHSPGSVGAVRAGYGGPERAAAGPSMLKLLRAVAPLPSATARRIKPRRHARWAFTDMASLAASP